MLNFVNFLICLCLSDFFLITYHHVTLFLYVVGTSSAAIIGSSSGISYRLTVLSCRKILLSVYVSDSNVSSLLMGFNSHSQIPHTLLFPRFLCKFITFSLSIPMIINTYLHTKEDGRKKKNPAWGCWWASPGRDDYGVWIELSYSQLMAFLPLFFIPAL